MRNLKPFVRIRTTVLFERRLLIISTTDCGTKLIFMSSAKNEKDTVMR